MPTHARTRSAFLTASARCAALALPLAFASPAAHAQAGPQGSLTAPQVIQPGTTNGCKKVSGSADVQISFTVGVDGKTSNIKIVKAPTPAIGACAADIVRTTVFQPATKDGKPMSVGMNVSLNVSPQ